MTDKERLERIIQMQYDGYTIWDMSEDDLVWLIEQAERAQELEEDLLELVKQNKELRKSIAFYSSETYNAHLERLLDRKEREIERYREAINNIIEKAMLFGTNEEVYEAIQDALKALENKIEK